MPTILNETPSIASSAGPSFDARVLLLSVVPPNTNYTGALMLQSMFKAVSLDKLSCFAVKTPRLDPKIHEYFKDIPYRFRNKPSEAKTRRLPGKLGSLECFAKECYTANITVPKIAAEVIQFIEKTKPEIIWCTLEGQTMIRLASILQKEVPLPMVTQIWDPPEWWMHDNGVDKWSRSSILKTFSSVLHNSSRVAAASWAMADAYANEHHCRTIPVVPGLPSDWAKEPATKLNNEKKLTIGFAGQMYSVEEWRYLLNTLDALDWKVEGREVEIVMLGHSFQLSGNQRRNIRYLGWCDQQTSLQILSECDILYCAYWFSNKFEAPAKLSFPSKLTSYLAAGRPILFHGPEYSSPYKFLKEHDAGMLCHGVTKSAISNALNQLVGDPQRYRQLSENGNRAFQSYLTEEYMRSQFLNALTESFGDGKA